MYHVRHVGKIFNKSGRNDEIGGILIFQEWKLNFLNFRNENRKYSLFQLWKKYFLTSY